MDEQEQQDFLTALGEELSWNVCPPVDVDEASPHECIEAVWQALGEDVTPAMLAALTDAQYEELADSFADWFDCEAPEVTKLREAIEATLVRWPVDEES